MPDDAVVRGEEASKRHCWVTLETGYSSTVYLHQALVGYLKFHQLREERSVAGHQILKRHGSNTFLATPRAGLA
ncbi:MAG: hypothetical protein FRX49_08125 [Trebouxia sp. A1-2]|nr:MAG: hypothetical protein FRX49_08125 [Trebouxia sp. A1-2]